MNSNILALAAVLASAPAGAQTADLQQVLSGKEFAHSLKLKDLTAEWRHVSIATSDKSADGGDAMKQLMQLGMMGQQAKGGANDAAGGMAAMSMLGGLFGGGNDSAPSYYTLGKTASIAGETFLVAYKLQSKTPNFMELIAQSAKDGGKEPDFAKLAADSKPTGETELALTLINVRSITTLGSIRPFDLNRELDAAAKAGGGGLMDLIALGSRGKEAAPVEAVTATTPATLTEGMEPFLSSVRSALKSDSQLSAGGSAIEVTGMNGSVVLKGAVTSARLKTRAENLTRNSLKASGISLPVVNQLTVKAGK
jgi:hypothetical protein